MKIRILLFNGRELKASNYISRASGYPTIDTVLEIDYMLENVTTEEQFMAEFTPLIWGVEAFSTSLEGNILYLLESFELQFNCDIVILKNLSTSNFIIKAPNGFEMELFTEASVYLDTEGRVR